jgi:hypothetical protein
MEEELLKQFEEDEKATNRDYIHYDYIKRFVKMLYRKIDMQDLFIAMVIKEATSMASEVDLFTIADINKIYDELYKEYVDDTKSTLINPRWLYKIAKPKVKRKKKRRML